MAKIAILTVDKNGNVKGKIVEGTQTPHITKPGNYIVLGVEEVKAKKKGTGEEDTTDGAPEA